MMMVPVLATLVLATPSLTAPARGEVAGVMVEKVVDVVDPVFVTHAGDGRLFVTRLRGQVVIVDDGELLPEPFLDITDRVGTEVLGLFSIAFHPDYATHGFVYTHRVEKGTLDSLVTRFRASQDDPSRLDPESEVVLLRIRKELNLHYGGQVRFGPDGYLYVSTGDTSDRDGEIFMIDPECASQRPERLEGKILRLDVDRNVDTEPYYGLPPDNPFVATGLGEVWALGLRNPYRFSFDRETGDLWIGDVGQDDREEVNFQPASSGGGENYGWKVMEGTACFGDTSGCSGPVPACNAASLTPPVLEYPHADGKCAVIGGVVYRGSLVPGLYGRYVYGDLCTGTLWAARLEDGVWTTEELSVKLPNLVSFAEDVRGEVYLTAAGGVYRFVDPAVPDNEPACAADAHHLCLNGGRFRVSVSWRTGAGQTGLGMATAQGEDSGSFWFFSSNNPEIFVKVLDACFDPWNAYWVFAAGLTDVATSLVVTDTVTGEARRYDRPLGASYEAVRDTSAFATCP